MSKHIDYLFYFMMTAILLLSFLLAFPASAGSLDGDTTSFLNGSLLENDTDLAYWTYNQPSYRSYAWNGTAPDISLRLYKEAGLASENPWLEQSVYLPAGALDLEGAFRANYNGNMRFSLFDSTDTEICALTNLTSNFRDFAGWCDMSISAGVYTFRFELLGYREWHEQYMDVRELIVTVDGVGVGATPTPPPTPVPTLPPAGTGTIIGGGLCASPTISGTETVTQTFDVNLLRSGSFEEPATLGFGGAWPPNIREPWENEYFTSAGHVYSVNTAFSAYSGYPAKHGSRWLYLQDGHEYPHSPPVQGLVQDTVVRSGHHYRLTFYMSAAVTGTHSLIVDWYAYADDFPEYGQWLGNVISVDGGVWTEYHYDFTVPPSSESHVPLQIAISPRHVMPTAGSGIDDVSLMRLYSSADDLVYCEPLDGTEGLPPETPVGQPEPTATPEIILTPVFLPTFSATPATINNPVGLTPVPTRCVGWDTSDIDASTFISGTIPSVNVCFEPETFVDNGLMDLNGALDWTALFAVLFTAPVVVSVIIMVRNR